MEEIRAVWKGEGLAFEATRKSVVTSIDGDGQTGVSPMGMLLESLAGCSGADVVDILRKGRQPIEGLEIRLEGDRRDKPPRFYTSIRAEFVIRGAVDPAKAERAVRLSFDTYCSVYHSLRNDLELEWKVRVEP
jgi:putative redox protein